MNSEKMKKLFLPLYMQVIKSYILYHLISTFKAIEINFYQNLLIYLLFRDVKSTVANRLTRNSHKCMHTNWIRQILSSNLLKIRKLL